MAGELQIMFFEVFASTENSIEKIYFSHYKRTETALCFLISLNAVITVRFFPRLLYRIRDSRKPEGCWRSFQCICFSDAWVYFPSIHMRIIQSSRCHRLQRVRACVYLAMTFLYFAFIKGLSAHSLERLKDMLNLLVAYLKLVFSLVPSYVFILIKQDIAL